MSAESVSVEVLFAPDGSLLPAGAAIVVVLTSDPVAAEEIVPVTVNVTVPEMPRLTVAAMLPLPEAGQLEPAVAVHVQAVPVKVAGNVSVTVAPVITDGPAFVATIVYVTPWPGVADATPSVLVIARSPVGVNVSVSVAELLAAVGSVTETGTATDAVFAKVPVAVVAMVDVNVNVAVPPADETNRPVPTRIDAPTSAVARALLRRPDRRGALRDLRPLSCMSRGPRLPS